MQKSQFRADYGIFLKQLRHARENAGFTQGQLGTKLAATQSFVSKCERGERRLDIVELRVWCKALGVPFNAFVSRLNRVIEEGVKK